MLIAPAMKVEDNPISPNETGIIACSSIAIAIWLSIYNQQIKLYKFNKTIDQGIGKELVYVCEMWIMLVLLHSALHIGESQLTKQALAFGLLGLMDGHCLGHLTVLKKHRLFRLKHVNLWGVCAWICIAPYTVNNATINKQLLNIFIITFYLSKMRESGAGLK